MATWTITIGDPSTESSSFLAWSLINQNVPSDLVGVTGTVSVRDFSFATTTDGSPVRLNLNRNGQQVNDADLTTAWEGFESAVVVEAGNLSLEISGPNHSSVVTSDTTEPYSWKPSTAQQTATDNFIAAFANLTQAQKDATTLTLRDSLPNSPPVITDPGDKTYTQGDTITPFTIAITDPDAGDSLTVSAVGLPSNLNFDTSTYEVSGVIANDATVQDYTVTITANDGTNPDVTQDFTITVNDNLPPTITNPGNQSFAQGEAVSVPVTITDPESDTITVGTTGTLPDGITFNTTTYTLEGTVASDATVQDYPVTITATDSINPQVSESFTITITAPTAATITGVSILSTPVAESDTYGFGEVIRFQVTYDTAVDVTGTPQFPTNFNQSPPTVPQWVDYASGSGTTQLVFEWTVAATDEDQNGLWLYGSQPDAAFNGDAPHLNLNGGMIRNAGTTVDASLALAGPRGTQSGHKVNGSLGAPPDFGSATVADQTYTQNQAITTLQLPEATGGTGDLTYSTSALTGGLSFDASTRQITGTPNTVGTTNVVYTVTDENSLTDTISFSITVNAPADLMPSFGAQTIPDQTYTQNVEITPLTLPEATGGDAPLTYWVTNLHSGLNFSPSARRISGTPDTVGTTEVTYHVTDADNDMATLMFSITVNAPAPPDSEASANVSFGAIAVRADATAETPGDSEGSASVDFGAIEIRANPTAENPGEAAASATISFGAISVSADPMADNPVAPVDVEASARISFGGIQVRADAEGPVVPTPATVGKILRITLDNGMTMDLEEGKDFEIRDPIISSVKQRAVNAVAHIYFNQNSTLHDWLVQNRVGQKVELIY